VRFDPVAHPVPGAGTYPWVRALRQPSYRLVQRRARPHPGAVGPGPRPGRADAAGHGG